MCVQRIGDVGVKTDTSGHGRMGVARARCMEDGGGKECRGPEGGNGKHDGERWLGCGRGCSRGGEGSGED